ncbi:MAG: SagB/ThcOx family dehydrogenase [Thiobacillaceae bacterium]|nr:SagB/ThcOx family dehydrogenase [Thiobacillaceae bacterium]
MSRSLGSQAGAGLALRPGRDGVEAAAREVWRYHRASKHHLHRYAPGPGHLDWATQPDPFRVYTGCPRLELPLVADALAVGYGAVRQGRLPAPAPFDRRSLAALFELTLGLAAWKQYGANRWALRCNPSSGNLHPTEGYLLSPALPDLQAGVYHYVSRDHALEQRAAWPQPSGPPLIAFTSIVWREAWKYGLRAFRYCQLDTGHAIAALSFAAAALGWRLRPLPIGEADLASLLGVDRSVDYDSAEAELPEALFALVAAEGEWSTALPAASALRWQGRANRLSPEHRHWPGLDEVAAATARPSAAVQPDWTPPVRHAPPSLAQDMPLPHLIRQRRSAQAYDGVSSMPAEVFHGLLTRLLPAAGAPPWTAWPYPPAVHLILFVHRVAGLTPGLYALPRDEAALPSLKAAMRPDWLWAKTGPQALPLYLLLPHDVRPVAEQLSCHQDIAADGCFAVAMLADFAALDKAPWLYRSRHWEAGLIGQVLYLEAEAAGLRGTGIGCFFDDAVHELLGLDTDGRWQVVYHFTVGGALEDTRLTTLPPYPPAFRQRG